jgi:hypothetical protein
MVGLDGAPAGVEEEAALGCPVPAALSAATTTTYEVPLDNPVILQASFVSPPLGSVAVQEP